MLVFLRILKKLSNQEGYIDPGAGTLIIQFLMALILGGLATIGIFWKKVKAWITRTKK